MNVQLSTDVVKESYKELDNQGFCVLNHLYSVEEVSTMIKTLDTFQEMKSPKENQTLFAIRDLLTVVPDLKGLLFNVNLKEILGQMGIHVHLTKALYFNKPAFSNWYVTWHQDRSIHVKEKINNSLYSGWTNKKGVMGVIPPVYISRNTLTVRIHLDHTTEENGVLKVIPGSHREALNDSEIKMFSEKGTVIDCEVLAGGVQLMKPLLIHSSKKSTNDKQRRVVHLEFNSTELPVGVEWAERMDVF